MIRQSGKQRAGRPHSDQWPVARLKQAKPASSKKEDGGLGGGGMDQCTHSCPPCPIEGGSPIWGPIPIPPVILATGTSLTTTPPLSPIEVLNSPRHPIAPLPPGYRRREIRDGADKDVVRLCISVTPTAQKMRDSRAAGSRGRVRSGRQARRCVQTKNGYSNSPSITQINCWDALPKPMRKSNGRASVRRQLPGKVKTARANFRPEIGLFLFVAVVRRLLKLGTSACMQCGSRAHPTPGPGVFSLSPSGAVGPRHPSRPAGLGNPGDGCPSERGCGPPVARTGRLTLSSPRRRRRVVELGMRRVWIPLGNGPTGPHDEWVEWIYNKRGQEEKRRLVRTGQAERFCLVSSLISFFLFCPRRFQSIMRGRGGSMQSFRHCRGLFQTMCATEIVWVLVGNCVGVYFSVSLLCLNPLFPFCSGLVFLPLRSPVYCHSMSYKCPFVWSAGQVSHKCGQTPAYNTQTHKNRDQGRGNREIGRSGKGDGQAKWAIGVEIALRTQDRMPSKKMDGV